MLGAIQLGFKTILVLTGGTRAEDLSRYPYKPDVVVPSIGELDHGGVLERLQAVAA
jgi:NagD protein